MFDKDPIQETRVFELVAAVHPVDNDEESSELGEYKDKINQYLASSLAKGTENQYFLAFQRFNKFWAENGKLSLPSDHEVVMAYLIKVAEEANSAAPALMMRSAIRHYNLLHCPDSQSPTDRADIALVIAQIC